LFGVFFLCFSAPLQPPEKLAALIKAIFIINSRRVDTFYQPQSSLISAFAMATKIKAAVIPIAIDYKVKQMHLLTMIHTSFYKMLWKRHTEIK
jgi:hypothetical protein